MVNSKAEKLAIEKIAVSKHETVIDTITDKAFLEVNCKGIIFGKICSELGRRAAVTFVPPTRTVEYKLLDWIKLSQSEHNLSNSK